MFWKIDPWKLKFRTECQIRMRVRDREDNTHFKPLLGPLSISSALCWLQALDTFNWIIPMSLSSMRLLLSCRQNNTQSVSFSCQNINMLTSTKYRLSVYIVCFSSSTHSKGKHFVEWSRNWEMFFFNPKNMKCTFWFTWLARWLN